MDSSQQWQLDQLRRIIADIGDQATVGGRPAIVDVSLADLRRLLAERIRGSSRRPDFFRGGVTVSSLTPLRWLPFRVICILGLDELGTSGAGAIDGDDLAATAPLVGDRDPRSEVRQALLEAVLAAGDHLVITRTGRNIRTNDEVPSATVLAELRDTITATLSPSTVGSYRSQVETAHPLQNFDDSCFKPGQLGRQGPWSFDSGALVGARARHERSRQGRSFIEEALPAAGDHEAVIDLADLQRFLRHPVKAFLRQRLQLHLLGEDRDQSDDLATLLDGLDRWSVADRLLKARLAGHLNAEWEHHERALGTLPPGGLGDISLHEIEETVDQLLVAAGDLGVDPARAQLLPVEVLLADGTRVVGTVTSRCEQPRPGPAFVTFSKIAPKHQVAAWVDLVALGAADPTTDWRSVIVARAERKGALKTFELVGRGDTTDARRHLARDALGVAVDLYRRGLREPIPLFASLSCKLHNGTASGGDWEPFGEHGDGTDEANRLAFGALGFEDLCALPTRLGRPVWIGAGTSSALCRLSLGRDRSKHRRAQVSLPRLFSLTELGSEESSPRVFSPTGRLPTGSVAIEASAGTGKTYALAGLVVRYVAEAAIPVEELLIVTFTRAAAAELRDRVRTRLTQAVRALRDPSAHRRGRRSPCPCCCERSRQTSRSAGARCHRL